MRVAALTMMYNEPVWARVWARYYARQVGAAHCFVLDHGSDDGSLERLGVRVERMARSALDEDARAAVVSDRARALLRHYDAVVHSDADELVVADPERFGNLVAFAAQAGLVTTTLGLDLQHLPGEEGALDPARPLGEQRRWARFSSAMCKPVLVRTPVRWSAGFHTCDAAPVFGGLYLVHLRYADLVLGLRRLARTRGQVFATEATNLHQRVGDGEFEGMVQAIATLPRADGELDALAEPLLARVQAGWRQRGELLGLAGDELWRVPDRVLALL